MSIVSSAYLVATGLVAAGLASSLWASVTGEALRVAVLEQQDFLLPVRVMALVVALPFLLARLAVRQQRHGRLGAVMGGLALSAALCWCFVQGVVIVVGIMRLAAVMG